MQLIVQLISLRTGNTLKRAASNIGMGKFTGKALDAAVDAVKNTLRNDCIKIPNPIGEAMRKKSLQS